MKGNQLTCCFVISSYETTCLRRRSRVHFVPLVGIVVLYTEFLAQQFHLEVDCRLHVLHVEEGLEDGKQNHERRVAGGGWYTTDHFTHSRNLTSQGSDGDGHSILKTLEHQLLVDTLYQRTLESAVVKGVAAVPFLSASALAVCIGCSISSTDLRERLR